MLGLSGGIDSSVVAALSVRALGADRVLGLLMPERESSEESLILGQFIGNHLGIETMVEDITPILEGVDCYRRRDAMIRRVIHTMHRLSMQNCPSDLLHQESYGSSLWSSSLQTAT